MTTKKKKIIQALLLTGFKYVSCSLKTTFLTKYEMSSPATPRTNTVHLWVWFGSDACSFPRGFATFPYTTARVKITSYTVSKSVYFILFFSFWTKLFSYFYSFVSRYHDICLSLDQSAFRSRSVLKLLSVQTVNCVQIIP